MCVCQDRLHAQAHLVVAVVVVVAAAAVALGLVPMLLPVSCLACEIDSSSRRYSPEGNDEHQTESVDREVLRLDERRRFSDVTIIQ